MANDQNDEIGSEVDALFAIASEKAAAASQGVTNAFARDRQKREAFRKVRDDVILPALERFVKRLEGQTIRARTVTQEYMKPKPGSQRLDMSEHDMVSLVFGRPNGTLVNRANRAQHCQVTFVYRAAVDKVDVVEITTTKNGEQSLAISLNRLTQQLIERHAVDTLKSIMTELGMV